MNLFKTTLASSNKYSKLLLRNKVALKTKKWDNLKKVAIDARSLAYDQDQELRRLCSITINAQKNQQERAKLLKTVLINLNDSLLNLSQDEHDKVKSAISNTFVIIKKKKLDILKKHSKYLEKKDVDKLKNNIEKLEMNPINVLMRIKQMELSKPTKLVKNLTKIRLINKNDILTNAYVCTDLLASKAAYNHIICNSIHKTTISPNDENITLAISDLKRINEETSRKSELLFDELFKILKKGKLESIEDEADKTSKHIELLLTGMAELISKNWVIAKNSTNLILQITLFEQILNYSNNVKALLLLKTYCNHLYTYTLTCNPEIAHEIEAAQKLSFQSCIEKGNIITIDKLKTSQINPDSLVAVQGIVTELKTGKDPIEGKFGTRFLLKDIINEQTILVRAKMFGLIDNGLINGAFCKVNGKVSHYFKNGKREIIFDIDRCNFTNLAKKSWLDYIALVTRKYNKYYRDEMNMTFIPYLI